MKKNLLNKYFFFSLLLLIVLIISVLITLNWFSSFMFSISNLLIVIWKIPDSLKFPYKNINILVDIISKSSLAMFTFCVTIWISYMLNFILPKSLQKKDIPIKERVKRGFIKFALLSFIIFLTIIFSVINKDNFSSVTIFTTLFTFICTPQMILRVFSNYKNIEKLEISEGVLRTFDYIKLLYYECLFSWSISIYIFQAQNTETKIEVFAISLFLLMFVTLISQKLIFKFNKQIFSNWIVSVDNKNKYKLIKEKQSRKYKITKKL
ncbi:hypothetical protein KGN15_013300 (plasmid) [Lactococcus lactis]|uniref:hypothetical protein n=1 Tax=Lactococcus lactis TaxID=1358 RepID=UPI001C1FE893|nr:hypothetical protein [Lactococcus lactis]